jgi:hypothetical protein
MIIEHGFNEAKVLNARHGIDFDSQQVNIILGCWTSISRLPACLELMQSS